ncbi:outer membrane lipoprotein-sorting protein [Lunatibacter salilacus]|uniref:outer membrane lipoprotein-sorting protein n=1 Tax=Lunatibacter salilacus TaxID=2483804 RepID=UPI00131E304A|nr:outer membrane lipoprotein-sorting protein [Lunatibacter salilacus]
MQRRFSLLLIFVPLLLKAQTTPDASEIIRKAEDQLRGNSSEASISMSVIRPDYTRNVSFKSWSLGDEYGLTLITSPARDRGMAFLKRGREVWNWQPSIDRSIKMPPSMMLQGWMGSDLTTEDLVRQNSILNDYDHKLLADANVDGNLCYTIALTPKEQAAVVWGKLIMYIGKSDYLQYKTEFFDEDMELVNTITGKVPKKFGSRTVLTHLEVIPEGKPGHKTIFKYDELEFDVELRESFFSLQNLKRLRP